MGNAQDRVRLDGILGRRRLTAPDWVLLLSGQRPDGGFSPFWLPGYTGVDATCFRLAQTLSLPGSDNPGIFRAVGFLEGRQAADGSFEEAPEAGEAAPPWARPGDVEARLYLTANAGGILAQAGRLAGAARARDHLASALLPDGRLPVAEVAEWLSAAMFFRLGDARAHPLLWALTPRIAALGPGMLAWVLTSLLGADVPARHPVVAQAWDRMTSLQREDGAFSSQDGPAFDATSTLEAIRAARLYEDGNP